MKTFTRVLGTTLIIGLMSGAAVATPLPSPYLITPVDTDGFGASARNDLGSFRDRGDPEQYRFFIGTDVRPGGFTMDFSSPFTDGAGADFAILTNSQSWGALAGSALFEFILNGVVQTSFIAQLAPDLLFEFDLPGTGVVANRIRVTNISQDPPGINNLAVMTFDNAGVVYANPVPEASTLAMLSIGLACIALYRRPRPSN